MSYEFYDWIIFNDIRTIEIKKTLNYFQRLFLFLKLKNCFRFKNNESKLIIPNSKLITP